MVVKQAAAGAKGGDFNTVLSAQICKEAIESGLSFVIRYIPRTAALVAGNLTSAEIQTILTSGLGLSAVMHCPLPGWEPSAELGETYGQFCADYCKSIGLPGGMNIWLDLEEVSSAATAEDTIAYCQAWYSKVAEGNYLPALYVGWGNGLTPDELYKSTSFRSYWNGYNYDDGVSVRGFQIEQQTQKVLNGVSYDPDIVSTDLLGDLPIFLYNS